MSTEKPWGGRFSERTDKLVEDFTASIGFDQRLYREDIRGSIAHCRMLTSCKVISLQEGEQIIAGLQAILKEIESGEFVFSVPLEDIHMNIESRLSAMIGAELAGKLHTARSRNDQVALDIRLYLKKEVPEIKESLRQLIGAFIDQAERSLPVVMPGFTHLQQAQPVLFSHHLLAYVEMFGRDYGRLENLEKQSDVLPLGAGALAGTSFAIDRQQVADELGFAGLTANSMDAVSDRDGVLEMLFAAALIMVHLSRFCEELVLWSTVQFDFISLADSFCTGSSIMPQKKNPDVPELIRGKCGRVIGSLVSLLVTMKALPLAYNKDMQEDKEPLFDAVDTVKASLAIMAPLVATMSVKQQKMASQAEAGFSTATEIADYLVRRGLPFRQAHEIVGNIVASCVDKGLAFSDLGADDWLRFSPFLDAGVESLLSADDAVQSKDVYGGTARRQVSLQLERVKQLWQKA
ncbi:MAG: argininosuccinate lyase [Deltaproteobacteria bacterium]|nr:argininosuccinate lyase [Candidatus Anaeroferrophillus wilburensis]MBN2888675.1 argininosuccinate lyase [Deltaproteobacteria bacterium]